MNAYQYDKNDGKLHTRYTELMQCSETGITSVLDKRFGRRKKGFTNDSMEFGKMRHDKFEVESKKTKKLPKVFLKNIAELRLANIEIDYAEHSFATELFPGVVIHFTVDSIASKIFVLFDYKTAINSDTKYFQSKQLTFYAMLLEPHGIYISTGMYLVEFWNKDHDQILGYSRVPKKIGILQKAEVMSWARKRVDRLKVGIDYYNNELELTEV